jgi:hypothetical protein
VFAIWPATWPVHGWAAGAGHLLLHRATVIISTISAHVGAQLLGCTGRYIGTDIAEVGFSLVSRMRPIMGPAREGLPPDRAARGAGGLRVVLAGKRLRSDLVGGHDPQLADGGVAGAGDHVGDAVGDVLGARTSVCS